MVIVRVDDRGRMTIPKELGIRETKIIIIPASSFLVLIPIPKSHEKATGWLKTSKSRKYLKTLAENVAREDAVKRANRRRQL